MNSYPSALKISISEMINKNLSMNEQLIVIYYNKFKNLESFSFEHFCNILSLECQIPINRLLKQFKKTEIWNINQLNQRQVTYLIDLLLKY
jgi:hypothetical protein